MSALTFKLKSKLPASLDVSGLIPSRLSGKSVTEIQKMPLGEGRASIAAGDIFDVAGADTGDLRFLGDCKRLDFIGARLDSGRILVEGDAGSFSGMAMTGGMLTIAGSAGNYAGASMTEGVLKIEQNAGDFTGGALPGETAGMRGGLIVVRGKAGDRAGDRMRRGTIFVAGDAGDYAASRMVAGTLAVLGKVGAYPGYLMKRGSIVLRQQTALPANFIDGGLQDYLWVRVLARFLAGHGVEGVEALGSQARRYSGDIATGGKGEILSLLG